MLWLQNMSTDTLRRFCAQTTHHFEQVTLGNPGVISYAC